MSWRRLSLSRSRLARSVDHIGLILRNPYGAQTRCVVHEIAFVVRMLPRPLQRRRSQQVMAKFMRKLPSSRHVRHDAQIERNAAWRLRRKGAGARGETGACGKSYDEKDVV